VDHNGVVNGLDLTEAISNWTTTTTTPIPEPTSLTLLAALALVPLTTIRKGRP